MNEANAAITANARMLRRERGTRRHTLEQIEGDGTSATVVLNRDEMVIGRGADTQIRLSSKRASRQHAFWRLQGTDCLLVDNDSKHGVYLNGVKIHSAVLRDGDVIQVADSWFVYHED
jgi:pSer/pThr/pTyr-binding forkhead associated (FHA) protein